VLVVKPPDARRALQKDMTLYVKAFDPASNCKIGPDQGESRAEGEQ
jgi:hypothetical protein